MTYFYFCNSSFYSTADKPKIMTDNAITFIGHSTLLINIGGFKILTDPILTNWVYCVPRIRRAKINVERLDNNVDLILISHAHNDHLNKGTLKKFSREIPIATHFNNKNYLNGCQCDNIIEFDHWQKKEFLNGNIKITLVPASHSKTLPWGPFGTPGGFIIESEKHNIYFAGDTSFCEDILVEISQRFKIDTLLMPVGAYSPRWLLKNEHVNPEEALKALKIIGAKKMIPIHWGSFMLALDTPQKPIRILRKKIKGTDFENKVVILKNGETFYF